MERLGPVILLLWAMLQLGSVLGVLGFLRQLPRRALVETPAGIVVIAAVRGPIAGLEGFVRAVLAQDAAGLRVIFAVEADTDPAYAALASAAAREPERCSVVIAGLADDEGQKVHNLLAALAALRPSDRYLVFLDSDMRPPRALVGRLLFPIVRGSAEIASGYRWLVPSPGAPFSWLAAALNLQVATMLRHYRWNLPWGGAMALSRETFERLGVAEMWRGALSDDLRLYVAARRGRARIRSLPDLLLPSPAELGLGGLWRFGVRQYRHVVWNAPALWGRALLLLGLNSVGWSWALGGALAGATPPLWGIAIGYAAAWSRALARIKIARRLGGGAATRAKLSVVWDVAAPFAVCWLHLLLVVAAPLTRRIRWAGADYWMGAGKVRRMERHQGR